MNTIVSFKNVIKRYGKITALDDLTFDIIENECVAIIGNNGSGKTTAINVLSNIIEYDQGEILYKEKKITQNFVSYKKELGILLSKPYYIEEFSVNDYWFFLGKYFKVPKKELLMRINTLLSTLDLEDKKNDKILHLSSGNQVKVSFGATLLHNPQLLLLDEPFVHLDINTIDKICVIINKMKTSKTILITSHSLDLVVDVCDSFFIIDKGKIIKKLTKSECSNKEELKNSIRNNIILKNKEIDLTWLK